MRLFLAGASVLALVTAVANAQTGIPFTAAVEVNAPAPTPFANNNGQIPPHYPKPLFELSHDYPAMLPPALPDPPWRRAIGDGPITVANAGAYVAALKEHVAHDMRLMLSDSPGWSAPALGWYSEPWTGYLREPTHGAYVGSSPFPPDLFNGSGLTKPFTTYVLTFYDRRTAHSLFNVWGATALTPKIETSATQFAEASVVVKATFSTANADVCGDAGRTPMDALYLDQRHLEPWAGCAARIRPHVFVSVRHHREGHAVRAADRLGVFDSCLRQGCAGSRLLGQDGPTGRHVGQ